LGGRRRILPGRGALNSSGSGGRGGARTDTYGVWGAGKKRNGKGCWGPRPFGLDGNSAGPLRKLGGTQKKKGGAFDRGGGEKFRRRGGLAPGAVQHRKGPNKLSALNPAFFAQGPRSGLGNHPRKQGALGLLRCILSAQGVLARLPDRYGGRPLSDSFPPKPFRRRAPIPNFSKPGKALGGSEREKKTWVGFSRRPAGEGGGLRPALSLFNEKNRSKRGGGGGGPRLILSAALFGTLLNGNCRGRNLCPRNIGPGPHPAGAAGGASKLGGALSTQGGDIAVVPALRILSFGWGQLSLYGRCGEGGPRKKENGRGARFAGQPVGAPKGLLPPQVAATWGGKKKSDGLGVSGYPWGGPNSTGGSPAGDAAKLAVTFEPQFYWGGGRDRGQSNDFSASGKHFPLQGGLCYKKYLVRRVPAAREKLWEKVDRIMGGSSGLPRSGVDQLHNGQKNISCSKPLPATHAS